MTLDKKGAEGGEQRRDKLMYKDYSTGTSKNPLGESGSTRKEDPLAFERRLQPLQKKKNGDGQTEDLHRGVQSGDGERKQH